jgi:glycosyltransferase involved in cell wall biosynthesis
MPGVSKNISEEYTAAHLFVLPSRYESLGLTTAEAMAHGLPAIGFDDCPGTRWLIRPGVNGELATGSGNRPAALAAALQPLMKDGDLRARLSMRSLEVSKQFGLKDVLDLWERLIWEVKVAA